LRPPLDRATRGRVPTDSHRPSLGRLCLIFAHVSWASSTRAIGIGSAGWRARPGKHRASASSPEGPQRTSWSTSSTSSAIRGGARSHTSFPYRTTAAALQSSSVYLAVPVRFTITPAPPPLWDAHVFFLY